MSKYEEVLNDLKSMSGYCPDHYDESPNCQQEAAAFVRDHMTLLFEALTRMVEIEEGKSVVVPVEPTNDMSMAGVIKLGLIFPDKIDPYISLKSGHPQEIYRAMIAAREGK